MKLERVIELFHQYNADYDKQFEKIQKRVVYEKYGIGGETVGVGFAVPNKFSVSASFGEY